MHLLEVHLHISCLVLVLQLTIRLASATCWMTPQPQNDFTLNMMQGDLIDMTLTVVPFTGCPTSSEDSKNY